MDARAPIGLAPDGGPARPSHCGGPGPVMTAVGQTHKPGNLRRSLARRERAG
jgi:hypothetical protein